MSLPDYLSAEEAEKLIKEHPGNKIEILARFLESLGYFALAKVL
jgi:hypothetical protein